jgi:hypothetical protein
MKMFNQSHIISYDFGDAYRISVSNSELSLMLGYSHIGHEKPWGILRYIKIATEPETYSITNKDLVEELDIFIELLKNSRLTRLKTFLRRERFINFTGMNNEELLSFLLKIKRISNLLSG